MSFQQGLSGLNGAAKALDAISNNVANTGTVGFKASQAQFSDVYASSLASSGNQIGIGTTIGQVAQQFTQGNVTVTNNPLDVAVNGQGFFRMSNNGAITFSRNGQFLVDKNGYITNAAGYRLTGYAADVNGTIIPAAPTDVFINTADISPRKTSKASVGLNLDSRQTAPLTAFNPANPLPQQYNASSSLTAYDTLGNPHVMTMYFVKTSTAGQWSLYTSLDGVAHGGPGEPRALDFDTNGALTGGASQSLSFALPASSGAATPLAFELNFAGSTQFGSSFGVNRVVQDGYASGRLTGISVGADGVVQGRYSNGQSRSLSQVVLANFNNPNGLASLGGNQWGETSESGPALVGAPGSASLGVLQSAAIEESNVDLTAELVNMITQQRAYQANAQSVKTQDQILQTLVNLR
jgi:flagellar hook protein FlgE